MATRTMTLDLVNNIGLHGERMSLLSYLDLAPLALFEAG